MKAAALERAHADYVAWRVEALGGTGERLPGGGVIARSTATRTTGTRTGSLPQRPAMPSSQWVRPPV